MAAISPGKPPIRNYFDSEVLFHECQSYYHRHFGKIGLSIAMAMVSKRLNLIFDSFYPILPQRDAHVCINIWGMERQFGQGDFTFANKVAKGLYDELGCKVTILSPFPAKHQSLAEVMPLIIKHDKRRILDSVFDSHLTFVGPVRNCWEHLEKLLGEDFEIGKSKIVIHDGETGQKRDLKIQKLCEYSVYQGGNELPLGPDVDEGGMYLDERRVRCLPLQRAVAELSDYRLRTLLESLITADARIYFGYGHNKSLCLDFINIIAKYEGQQEGQTAPIIICLIEGSPLLTEPIVEELRTNTLNGNLEWNGFSQVFTHSTKTSSLKTGTGRPLHLITLNSLPHSDVLKMQLLSEFLQLGTGDYSISELISLEELVWLYDLLPHKIPMFRKMCEQACAFFNEAEPLMVLFLKAFDKHNIEEVVKILKEKKDLLFRQFYAFNRFLKSEANAKKRIAHLASRVLIQQQTEIRFKIKDLEKKIKKSIRVALKEEKKPEISALLQELSDRIQKATIEVMTSSCLKQTLGTEKPIDNINDIICNYLHSPVPD